MSFHEPLKAKTASRTVDVLRARGFDNSREYKDDDNGVSVVPLCSQCEVLVINGVACHEIGCPNATKDCKGCDDQVPKMGPGYCENCR